METKQQTKLKLNHSRKGNKVLWIGEAAYCFNVEKSV